MSKLYTLLIGLISLPVLAQDAPVVPEYGKLLLIEERQFKKHWEMGLDGGVALDNTTEDVYSLTALGNYVFSPLFSAGLEISYNETSNKDYLEEIENAGNVKVSNYTPDWFSQAALRMSVIKGHSNLLNKWQTPFELAAVLGAGLGINNEQGKTSSLISWGGELKIPVNETYKTVIGIRHYKSYPFQTEELSFTSLLAGLRIEL